MYGLIVDVHLDVLVLQIAEEVQVALDLQRHLYRGSIVITGATVRLKAPEVGEIDDRVLEIIFTGTTSGAVIRRINFPSP